MSQAALRQPDSPTIPMPSVAPAPEWPGDVSGLLKSPEGFARAIAEDRCGWRLSAGLLGMAVGCYALYGLTMGVFSGGHALWMAALKAPLILVASLGLCAPSLYVLLCLNGTPLRWRQAVALLAGVACLSSLLLVGFAPVAWLFGVSTDQVEFMVLLHLAAWGLGMAAGLRLLGCSLPGGYRRHKALVLWVAIYLVVSAQMLTYFRPVLDVPTHGGFRDTKKTFFFQHFAETMTAGLD